MPPLRYRNRGNLRPSAADTRHTNPNRMRMSTREGLTLWHKRVETGFIIKSLQPRVDQSHVRLSDQSRRCVRSTGILLGPSITISRSSPRGSSSPSRNTSRGSRSRSRGSRLRSRTSSSRSRKSSRLRSNPGARPDSILGISSSRRSSSRSGGSKSNLASLVDSGHDRVYRDDESDYAKPRNRRQFAIGWRWVV